MESPQGKQRGTRWCCPIPRSWSIPFFSSDLRLLSISFHVSPYFWGKKTPQRFGVTMMPQINLFKSPAYITPVNSWVFLMALRRFPPSRPGFVSLVTEVVHAQTRLEQVFDLGGSAGSGHHGGGWKTSGVGNERWNSWENVRNFLDSYGIVLRWLRDNFGIMMG